MGTLYIVGVPLANPEDLVLRARRILDQADCLFADDLSPARRLLAHYEIETPLAPLKGGDDALAALATGDVALLVPAGSPAAQVSIGKIIEAALDRAVPVVPIPAPALPVTALVLSGLPADSFLCLGPLPTDPPARRALWTSAAGEPRSLVALASSTALPEIVADLHPLLDDQLLVVVCAFESGAEVAWQGSLGSAAGQAWDLPPAPCALVVGGAPVETGPWDEGQLQAEIERRLARGLQAKEIGRDLARLSGWPRREIYRRAVDSRPDIHAAPHPPVPRDGR